jgi:DNA-binding beta-propeller fold protein YncE
VGSPPQALVTAQTEDRLLLVDLPSDQVLKSVTVGGDPEYAAAAMGKGGAVVVVNSASGTVTLLDRDSLRTIKSLGGFASPHIPAISPDDQYAYVTDDARGQVTVIGLYDDKVLSRISVGAGAHHLAFSPDERQVWVALGQSASTIAILSTVVDRPPPPSSPFINLGHPRLIGSFAPGYLAHDLLFAPNGKQVWITSANTSDVGVFSTRTHHLLFRVPAGPPPQHVAFAGRFVYITSGYGSSIEQVALKSGRVLARARAPYGSFDLDATRAYVVAASLLRGTLAVYNPHLGLLRVAHLAPSTEDVVISQP